jgi:molybdopterin/thiamine biosynthesis adenylyltransferase
MLHADNALEICQDYDIIIDGTDTFQTRALVNDVCVLLGKPNVYGAIFCFEGQASVCSIRGQEGRAIAASARSRAADQQSSGVPPWKV